MGPELGQVVLDEIDGPRFLKRLLRMPAGRRAGYLMIGSAGAGLSLLIPDMYRIDYQGPPLPGVNLDGIVGDFSALNGPYDGKPLLGSVIFLFLLGFATRYLKIGYDTAWKHLTTAAKRVHILHHGLGIGANLFGLWSFFGQFDEGGLPAAVSDAFVARAGGTAQAKAQTAYLYPSLGGTTVLLMLVAFGLLLIGVLPLVFAIVDALALAYVVISLGGAAIGLYLPWVTFFQDTPTANGQRPFVTTGQCVLSPGKDDNCESPEHRVKIELPNPAPNTVGCTYSLTVDWGDHTEPQTTVAAGTTTPILAGLEHTYGSEDAYVLTVSEKVTAGSCIAAPTSWRPEFAVAVKH